MKSDQSLRDQFFESIFQINPADQTFGEIGTIDHEVIDCNAIDHRR